MDFTKKHSKHGHYTQKSHSPPLHKVSSNRFPRNQFFASIHTMKISRYCTLENGEERRAPPHHSLTHIHALKRATLQLMRINVGLSWARRLFSSPPFMRCNNDRRSQHMARFGIFVPNKVQTLSKHRTSSIIYSTKSTISTKLQPSFPEINTSNSTYTAGSRKDCTSCECQIPLEARHFWAWNWKLEKMTPCITCFTVNALVTRSKHV